MIEEDYLIDVPIDDIPIDGSEVEDVEDENREIYMSWGREKWIVFTDLVTFWAPDCILKKTIGENRDVRQAWREKITIFIFFILFSCLFIFIVAILPKLICVNQDVFTWKDVYESNRKLMILKGKVIDVEKYNTIHPGPIDSFLKFLGHDITYMFNPPDYYYSKPDRISIYNDELKLFNEYKNNDTTRYCRVRYCHDFPFFIYNSSIDISKYVVGDILVSYKNLQESRDPNWFVLYDRVYNISEYVQYGHPVYPSKYDRETTPKEVAYYLDQRLNNTILSRIGQDATNLFESVFRQVDRKSIVDYLDVQYFIGKLDTRYNPVCAALDILYLVILGCIASILVVKFLLALCILRKQYPKLKSKYVIVFIPCYTEDHSSIEKTVNSIYDNKYPDKKKLIFIVVDGVVKGRGNDLTTAEITLNIFNRSLKEYSNTCRYRCTHEVEDYNNARVYSGWHTNNGHTVPYIVVVKTGNDNEKDIYKPGNRGKRDSQLILLNFISRAYYGKNMSQLDEEIYNHILNNLNLTIDRYEYILSVDADTEVDKNSMYQMVCRMKNDPKIYALCGETLVSNKLDSWVTAIQVYEYYFNHNLNKAFESLFNSVTCLPGCFTMFRIKTDCKRQKPIVIHDKLLIEYSDNNVDTMHKKNLLLLGEDRFFTTLLTKYFPESKLKYITEAKCRTVVPSKWSVLLSQRRRWINSTLHNLFRLMWVRRLCGVCCFSMKFMLFVDLLTTLFLPASCSYLIYLIFAFSTGMEPINIVFITMSCVIVGIQVLIFVVKRDFIYILWLILYIVALPIWMIVLPIYAFSKMDDFSWGKTRKIDSL